MSDQKDEVPILRAEGLGYQVGDQRLVDGIQFSLHTGDRLAVVGPSGAGKTTLLRMLNRLLEPTRGTVYLEGQDYRLLEPRELRRRVGMMMQIPYLFPGTVADNIRFGPRQRSENLPDEVVRDLLERVDLKGFGARDINQLSVGEAQRVSLARTLANRPHVLLLDEPTSALDEASRKEVEALILGVIEAENLTCILVTHDRAQTRRMANRLLQMEKGRQIGEETLEGGIDAHWPDH